MNRLLMPALACLLLGVPASALADPEVLPPPREVGKFIHIESIKTGGYQITLSREGAEFLRDGLVLLGDGKSVVDIARLVTKKRNDPEVGKQIEFLALILKSQAPAIRKALDEKTGPNGAVIKVYGIEKKRLPAMPLLKSLGEAFLPNDWNDLLKTGITVANTTPLLWRVEERK